MKNKITSIWSRPKKGVRAGNSPVWTVTKHLTTEGKIKARTKKEAIDKFNESNWDDNLNLDYTEVEKEND